MPDNQKQPIDKTGWKELGWFVILWACGVAAITIVGGLIKFIL